MRQENKRCIIEYLRRQYRRQDKLKRGKILDGICEDFGVGRRQAKRLIAAGKVGRPRKFNRTGRPGKYRDKEFKDVLKKVWRIMRYICSRSMRSGIELWLPSIEETYSPFRADIRERLLTYQPSHN